MAACASAPKTSHKHSTKKYRNYSYYESSGDPANQDSIEDVIYSELSKRQQALLRKYSVPTTVHSLSGVKFDIPVTINDRVSAWIDYFANGSGRKHFERYLSRSTRFVPTELSILKEVGVPKDLIFLSMIESGFNTHAYSSAAASGLWQFIRSTGRLYGLDSDYWVDERRNPEKATLAAAQHLKDLYGEFGDWYLAFAAYNAGAGKVRRAISGTGSNNFWDLANSSYLRQETKDYVPKILAAAIISKSPEKYGFNSVEFQDPIATEKVTISTPTDMEMIAECVGVDSDLIRLINPELVRNMTPPDRSHYQIYIPRGTRGTFERKYAHLSPSERLKNVQYIAKGGESLRDIALENGVSVASLSYANPNLGNHVRSGMAVLIPHAYDSPPSVPSSSGAFPTATKGSRLLDLIADNSDRRPEKNKKKKGREAKELAKEGSGDEMKVAWRDSIKTEPTKTLSVIAEANATEKPAVENAVAGDASHAAELAANDAGKAESAPASAEAPAAGNNEAQIAEALNKVGAPTGSDNANANSEEAAGTVRVKSSGQVASLEKTSLKSKKPSEKIITLKIKRGETLTQIAEKYGVSLSDLRDLNKIKGKGNLLIGQKIVVKSPASEAQEPLKSSKENSKLSIAKSEKKVLKAGKKPSGKVIAYKVRKGDTINKIAKKYDVSPSEILGLNGLHAKAALKPGLVLKIKTKSGQDQG